MNTQLTTALPPIEQHVRSIMSKKGVQEMHTFLRRIAHLQKQFTSVPEQCSPISLALFLNFYAGKRTGASPFLEDDDEINTFFQHTNAILREYEQYCSRFSWGDIDVATPMGLARIASFFYEAAFVAAYVKDKRILYVKSELIESIAECPFPVNTPARTLRYLPFPAFAFALGKDWYTAHYDYAIGKNDFRAEAEKETIITTEELRQETENFLRGQATDKDVQVSFAADGYDTENLILHVNKLLNNEARLLIPYFDIITSDAQMQSEIFTFGEKIEPSDPEIRKIVNILLYIAGSEDIVQRVGHTFTPRKKDIVRKEHNAISDKRVLAEPQTFDSGLRFSEAIQHYAALQAEQEANTEQGANGKTMRPHIRRAHPHLYWVNDSERVTEEGKPAKKPIVRYLSPIAVRGGPEKSTEIITIQQVK